MRGTAPGATRPPQAGGPAHPGGPKVWSGRTRQLLGARRGRKKTEEHGADGAERIGASPVRAGRRRPAPCVSRVGHDTAAPHPTVSSPVENGGATAPVKPVPAGAGSARPSRPTRPLSPRSVEFRAEIGRVPRRDRFTSAPRSVRGAGPTPAGHLRASDSDDPTRLRLPVPPYPHRQTAESYRPSPRLEDAESSGRVSEQPAAPVLCLAAYWSCLHGAPRVNTALALPGSAPRGGETGYVVEEAEASPP